jgi:glycosyltransferase involved in cell wall biosynthesis
MRIAFATLTYSAKDITRGSGTFYQLSQELERQGNTVHYVGPISTPQPPISRLLRALHNRLGYRFPIILDPFIGVNTGNEVAQRVASLEYDVLLTNDLSIAAYTPSVQPIALYTDVMITPDYAERFTPASRLARLSPISLHLARRVIRRALANAALCVFPAQWAADSAQHYAKTALRKPHITIVPFGANVDDPGQVDRLFPRDSLDMLFIGKDWQRKGGAIAIEAAQVLRQRGIPARLHIVGATPNVSSPDVVIGMLDKAIDSHRKQLDSLFRTCDVLMLPTQSEGSVIVPMEAAAYGMPTLAYDAIGVTPSVLNGQSGLLLPIGAPPKAFADVLQNWYTNPESYTFLSQGARAHYERSANWTHTVSALMTHLNTLSGRPNTTRKL